MPKAVGIIHDSGQIEYFYPKAVAKAPGPSEKITELLTDRQREYMDLFAIGRNAKEIARELNVSLAAVKDTNNKLRSIFKCASTTQLVLVWHGVLPLDPEDRP